MPCCSFDLGPIVAYSDAPVFPVKPCNILLALVPQIIATPNVDPSTPTCKRPTGTPRLVGTNAAILVPEFIWKRFIDGWNIHVPLTYLTDKECFFKNKSMASSSQSLLTINNTTGCILTTAKPPSDDGELDLTFNEWHQALQHLLDLIKTFTWWIPHLGRTLHLYPK